MTVRLLATLALTAALLAGCGGEDSSAATLRGPLEYSREGGLRGVSEQLTIQRDGRSRVVGGRRGTRSFKLSRTELDRVARLVGSADIGRIEVPEGGGADVFYYAVSYRGSTLEFDDTTVPDEARDLVGALQRIVRVHG